MKQYLTIGNICALQIAEKILLYMDCDTGWKVRGGGKGKFCTHNKRFLKNALLVYKKIGAMAPRCPSLEALRWRPFYIGYIA